MSSAKATTAAIALALTIAAKTPPPTDDPRQLLAYIEHNGAKATVDQLASGDRSPRWEKVLSKIEAGGALWIQVAKRLAAGTDAATSEELPMSLAIALTHNPEGVLSIVGKRSELPIGIDSVCRIPGLETTEKQDRDYVRRAETALRNVHSPALKAKQEECLKAIKEDASKIVPQSARK